MLTAYPGGIRIRIRALAGGGIRIRIRKHLKSEVSSRHLQVLTAYLQGIRIRIRKHMLSEVYVYVYVSTCKVR